MSDSETERGFNAVASAFPRDGRERLPLPRARPGQGWRGISAAAARAPVRASGSAFSYSADARTQCRDSEEPAAAWLPNEILMIESGLLLWENGGTDRLNRKTVLQSHY